MKVRTSNGFYYKPETFEPVKYLVLQYNPDDALDVVAKGGSVEELLKKEFETLLTRDIGWDSDPNKPVKVRWCD